MKMRFFPGMGFVWVGDHLRMAWRAARLLVGVGISFLALPGNALADLQLTALDRYVAAPDTNYSYTLLSTIPGSGQTTYILDMTSQAWLTTNEVNRTLWKHWVIIVKPDGVTNSQSLLFISGGSNPGTPPTSADSTLRQIALDTGSIVTELKMVPNEPLTFVGEGFSRTEDELIAYTWDKFLRTGDEKWPARLPMTKAAVRAMDTVTSFCATNGGGLPVNKFVVSGASKRGWTTWTTAAVDQRVVAIIPAVIDLLNLEVSMIHHYRSYAYWSPAIQDYVNMGVMDWVGTPQFQALMNIEEPYSYRARLTMPKFELWAAGDQYFLPDSSQFYFPDLPGVKYMRCIPNADHSLNSDAYITLEGCYQSVLFQTPLPQFSWTLTASNTIRVVATDQPTTVKLWQAVNSTARDFRLETIGPAWTSSMLTDQGGGVYLGAVTVPPAGWKAFFVELTYNRSGLAPLKFTTQVYVVPDILPFDYTYPPPNYLPPDYPPPNDHFTNATKVPSAGGLYPSNSRFSTLEASEPPHAGVASVAGSLWWNWTPVQSTNVLLDTSGSTIDTALAVYTGNTLASLIPVVATNDVGSKKSAYLSFNAQAGQAYRIAVASVGASAIGYLQLRVTPGGQHDTTLPQVSVSAPLSGITVATNPISVTGTAADLAPNETAVRRVLVSLNGSFTYSATGTTNWTASALLQPGLNTITATAVDVAGNVSAPAVVYVTYVVVNPVNDLFVNALPLAGNSGTVSAITTNATKEFGEPNHAGNAGGKSVWWSFAPSADGVLTLTTTNSTFDTLLGLYTGTNVNALTTIASNDDAYPGAPGGFSSLTAAVRSNQVYRIAVDGYDGASGHAVLGYSFTPAKVYHLTITATNGTTLPTSLDVPSNATVSVSALANAGYVFAQWDGDVVSFANPVAVLVNRDLAITARFGAVAYTDGFESGNFTGLGWTPGGDQPWLVQNTNVAAGLFAARSGVIGPSQTSSLFLGGSYRAGVGSFDLRVSSELGWDFLSFHLDGVQQAQWSGEVGWTPFAFPISAGAHTLEWRYAKDPNVNFGLDAAFLDNVNLPVIVGTNSLTRAQLQARRASDGTVFINLTGQPNQLYLLQASTNLSVWQTIATNVAVGGFLQVVDPASSTLPARFYRAVVPTTP